jgi:hypothetical protein
MKSNYTRYGKNLLATGTIYDYVALDTVNNSVLRVVFRPSFRSQLPAEIAITAPANFTTCLVGNSHVVISEADFWKQYDKAIFALASVNPTELFQEENV